MIYLVSEDVASLTTVTLYSFLGDVITNCNRLSGSFVLITTCQCGMGMYLWKPEYSFVWGQFFLPPLHGFWDQIPFIRVDQEALYP